MSLPTIPLGHAKVSKLIAGCNPIVGNSHQDDGGELGRQMVDYFTAANVKKLLFDCERNGINTFQGVGNMYFTRILREHWNEGGAMQWIAQTDSQQGDLVANIRATARSHPIGIYHHGTRTGNLWRTGRIDELRPLLEEIKNLDIAAGVGVHFPEILEYIEEKDWPVDFYMTCFYNVYKNQKGWRESYIVSGVRFPEFFDDADRDKMARSIRTTPKPCLAFKILASGRKAENPTDRRAAFRFALENIKPTDGVVVGMFPRSSDQPRENAEIVSEIIA